MKRIYLTDTEYAQLRKIVANYPGMLTVTEGHDLGPETTPKTMLALAAVRRRERDQKREAQRVSAADVFSNPGGWMK